MYGSEQLPYLELQIGIDITRHATLNNAGGINSTGRPIYNFHKKAFELCGYLFFKMNNNKYQYKLTLSTLEKRFSMCLSARPMHEPSLFSPTNQERRGTLCRSVAGGSVWREQPSSHGVERGCGKRQRNEDHNLLSPSPLYRGRERDQHQGKHVCITITTNKAKN